MNDSHQHGRSSPIFYFTTESREETYVCSFHRYYYYSIIIILIPYAGEANLIFRGLCPSSMTIPPQCPPPFWPPAWLFPICNVHSSIYNGGQSGIGPGVWQMSKSTLMWHFFLSSFHELVGRLFEVLKRLCTYLVDALHVSLVTDDVTTPLFFSPFCSLFEYT